MAQNGAPTHEIERQGRWKQGGGMVVRYTCGETAGRICDTFDRALVNIRLGGSDRLTEHYKQSTIRLGARDGAFGTEPVSVIAIT